MREQSGKITHKTLIACKLDPLQSGLARFIPEEGVSPSEFIRLPVEQLLTRAGRRLPEEINMELLLTEGILPAPILHHIGIFAALEVLPLFESYFPSDFRPRQAIEAKQAWLNRTVTDEDLKDADYELQYLHLQVKEGNVDFNLFKLLWNKVTGLKNERAIVTRRTEVSATVACGAQTDGSYRYNEAIWESADSDAHAARRQLYSKAYRRLCEYIETNFRDES